MAVTRRVTRKKKARTKARAPKKDPIFVDGKRPRPMYVDYKDVETLSKLLTNRGKIYSRKRSGNCASCQRKAKRAIKRARYMALLPFTK